MSGVRCSCAVHADGSVTRSLCPAHASSDPCQTLAAVTGKRRKGSIVCGVCSSCGWRSEWVRDHFVFIPVGFDDAAVTS